MVTQKISQFWQKWWWALLALGLFSYRIPWFSTRAIPFNFDHGKDSLAVMHMLLTGSLKFVGPWTSIPGLYFGPAWYYFLAPWYLIGNFDPIWGLVAMIVLQLVTIYLVKREFGWLPALFVATAPTWLTISGSAWNPFPMPLMSFLILAGLERIRHHQRLELKGEQLGWWILIGFAAALGFHFSTAYAVFYPFIIGLTIWIKQLKLNFIRLASLLVGFCLPFLPQLAFELKHNFIETHSVINYIVAGGQSGVTKPELQQIITQTFAELQLAILPDVWLLNPVITFFLSRFALILIGLAIIFMRVKQRSWGRWWLELLLWVVLPTLLYSRLHYNLWYVLGMLPVVVLFVSDKLLQLPKLLLGCYVILLMLTPLSYIFRFYQQDLSILQASRQLLPIKEKTIFYIREKANGLPFAVYHYAPDIYDFTYQYLYLSQAKQGKQLPTEFSYQPNVTPYMTEKAELLEKLKMQADERKPSLIFFVVEQPQNHEFLNEWWGRQQYETIIEEVQVSPEVSIYVALPKR